MSIYNEPTWAEIVQEIPELEHLRKDIENYRNSGGRVSAWTWNNEFKPILLSMIPWGEPGYDTAYRKLKNCFYGP